MHSKLKGLVLRGANGRLYNFREEEEEGIGRLDNMSYPQPEWGLVIGECIPSSHGAPRFLLLFCRKRPARRAGAFCERWGEASCYLLHSLLGGSIPGEGGGLTNEVVPATVDHPQTGVESLCHWMNLRISRSSRATLKRSYRDQEKISSQHRLSTCYILRKKNSNSQCVVTCYIYEDSI